MQNDYMKARKAGYPATKAIRTAKILAAFGMLESDDCELGNVRLRVEPEQESYFDVFRDCQYEDFTDGFGRRVSAADARKADKDLIDRLGNWCVITEVWNGDEWEVADSIGHCAGYANPGCVFENWYVPDLMQSAIDLSEKLLSDRSAETAEIESLTREFLSLV